MLSRANFYPVSTRPANNAYRWWPMSSLVSASTAPAPIQPFAAGVIRFYSPLLAFYAIACSLLLHSVFSSSGPTSSKTCKAAKYGDLHHPNLFSVSSRPFRTSKVPLHCVMVRESPETKCIELAYSLPPQFSSTVNLCPPA